MSAPLRSINLAILLIVLLLTGPSTAAAPEPVRPPAAYCLHQELDDGRPRDVCISLAHYTDDVCTAIERYAEDADLPTGYFARLIWQESHFDPNAVSFAGAEGIAQFMPGTARLQGLVNPYDPAEALWRSAHYLRFLTDKFGNLGLAAAAYNGGEGAAARFIAGTGYLAAETIDYVAIVTGLPVTAWLAGNVARPDFDLQPGKPFHQACLELAEDNRVKQFTPPTAIVKPWGIQLAQFFSEAISRRAFTRIQGKFQSVLGGETLMLVAKRNPNFGPALRFTAEIGRDNRADAIKLCNRLEQAGGECIVVRN
jgi:Transglycosylase SLT domain